MRKKQPLNPKVSRQIEILQKYYDIDVENRIINFTLYYEKASDILINDVVTIGDAPRFNNDVLRRISEILDTFPTEFKVHLALQIDDYEGYEPQRLLDALKDSLEMFNYEIYRESGLRWFTAATLVFVSMSILSLRLFLGGKELIDTEGMFYEMLDIIAWVFLWQAVTVMFLTPAELKSISIKIMRRLLSVGFIDKEGNSLIKIESERLDEDWLKETRKEKTGRTLLLIAGTAFITIAVWNIIDVFGTVGDAIYELTQNQVFDGVISFILAAFTIVGVIIYAIGGVGAIACHRGKGPFRGAVKVFAVLSFIVATLSIVLTIYQEVSLVNAGENISGSMLFRTLLEIAVAIIYFIGYIFYRISTTDSSSITED